MTIGALGFLSPWLLLGLLALPIIYWLLRTVPPRPRQVAFPPTRILVGLENKEKTPAKTPWWLMLIRLTAAALVILALAEPVLNPNREAAIRGSGPVVLVVDNTWAAAARWSERVRMLDRLIAEAEAQERPVVVLATATPAKGTSLRIEAPQAARTTAAAIQPQPFAPARLQAVEALTSAMAGAGSASVVWLTDGLDHDGSAAAFAEALAGLGTAGFSVFEVGDGDEAMGVASTLGGGGRLVGRVVRAGGGAREGVLHAYSPRGQRLAEAVFRMAPGDSEAKASFELPLELRNQVARIEIGGERSAGAVHLLDGRSQWHRVGLISGETSEQAQPLLAPLYYIRRALDPFAELVEPKDANLAAGIDTVLKRNSSVVIMADIGTITGEMKTRVEEWVKKGGVLVRFAGPRLEKGGDDLLPVALRLGGRTLGGALSWSNPQPLAPMTEDSLFSGLTVPSDVTVSRQVLADPARLVPGVKVWARLKDGTPLVTAADRGQGQIVLFHVTANPDWSNLPLSGLFVEMLRRLSALGRRGAPSDSGPAASEGALKEAAPADTLAPVQTLDGFGVLRSPPPTAQAIPAGKLGETKPGPEHPPGFYGPQASPRAFNLIEAHTVLKSLPPLPATAERRAYEGQIATPLKPWLLAAALALLFVDILAVVMLQLGGLGLRSLRPAVRGAGALALAAMAVSSLILSPAPAAAQDWRGRTFPVPPDLDLFNRLPGASGRQSVQIIRPPSLSPSDAMALNATARVTFGYVLTGDPGTDEVSRAGLSGLVRVLAARTAVEAADPVGVNVNQDPIEFFPVLYWPVLPNARALSDATLAKIDAYMKQGGMIIFDTRDYGQGMPSGFVLQGGSTGTALQRLLGRLDIPRLEPVPDGHVLTKSFYLMRTFPGRWEGGQLWVEAEANEGIDQGRRARHADGVSSILVTSNDFAAAWALDERNRPLYPTVPGGEAQREMAFRTGINIVMYALTGNYKADQVHVPALLERLGQ